MALTRDELVQRVRTVVDASVEQAVRSVSQTLLPELEPDVQQEVVRMLSASDVMTRILKGANVSDNLVALLSGSAGATGTASAPFAPGADMPAATGSGVGEGSPVIDPAANANPEGMRAQGPIDTQGTLSHPVGTQPDGSNSRLHASENDPARGVAPSADRANVNTSPVNNPNPPR